MLQQLSQTTFYQNFQTIYLCVRLLVDKRCLLGIPWFYHNTWPFNICYHISFYKNNWLVIGFRLDCQSKIVKFSNSLQVIFRVDYVTNSYDATIVSLLVQV